MRQHVLLFSKAKADGLTAQIITFASPTGYT